jgi:hypothetical protein
MGLLYHLHGIYIPFVSYFSGLPRSGWDCLVGNMDETLFVGFSANTCEGLLFGHSLKLGGAVERCMPP